jgi:hypothetical protein
LHEAVAVMLRTSRLDANRCPGAYPIKQLVSIADGVMPRAGKSLP